MRHAFLFAVLLLAGCAHPASRPIILPTTAAVRAPIVAATATAARAEASNARATAIAQRAAQTGIAAASQAARDLVTATQTTGIEIARIRVQLATATAAVDQLTAQLLAAQQHVDVLARHDAAETVRADKATAAVAAAVHSLRMTRLFVLLLFVGTFASVGFVGSTLETIIRSVAAAAWGFLVSGWHVAISFILRFWPVLLAAI